ncbi:MAG: copper-binding protein [Planctomycetota bacterium]
MTRRLPRPTHAVALLGVALTLAACGETETQAPGVEPIVNTYVTRGVVAQLPDAADATTALMIRHEAIPEFVGRSGEVEPMDTMTMQFPPADGLDLTGLSVGDKVAATFVVTWGGPDQGFETTEIETLPDDTELDFTSLKNHDHDHADHDHHDHDH